MRRRLVLLLCAAGILALLALGLARWPRGVSGTTQETVAEPAAPLAAEPPAPSAEAAASAAASPSPAAHPEPVPEKSAGSATPTPPVAAAPPAPAAVAAPASPGARPDSAAALDTAPDVPLEKLLTLREPPPPAGALTLDRNPHLRRGEAPGAAGATGDEGLRVTERTEQVGPGGETSVKQTEASVGVPVGESVDLRGGVEVERLRQHGEEAGTDARPKVGFEVRF